jgi:hypothetical protein
MGRWNVAEKSIEGFVGTPEVKNCFVDLGVDGGLILKCILNK